ncbi:MAG: hypothetical protein XE10_2063 [Methanoculleus marisnigri]|jgi:hypothetical protein|uniref:Uncharacterized protein n=1 Tax=Methanoculleus marisnigri TaxID=2198 RepID=A0A124G3Y8_9EURY|nr:MAG: hypothetical protein XE10_2063 [Methanoculleus marisnigri]
MAGKVVEEPGGIGLPVRHPNRRSDPSSRPVTTANGDETIATANMSRQDIVYSPGLSVRG